MRDIQILVPPFEFHSLTKVEIHKTANEHFTACIQGTIQQNQVKDYSHIAATEQFCAIKAKIQDEKNNKEETLFVGLLENLSLQSYAEYTELEIRLISATYLLDLSPHLRVFQNPEQKVTDLVKSICTTYGKTTCLFAISDELKLNRFVVQYAESDWVFLKRLASLYQLMLIPNDSHEGLNLSFGLFFPPHKEISISPTEGTWKRQSSRKRKKEAYGLEPDHELEFHFSSRDYYPIMQKLKVQKQSVWIFASHSVYEGGELIHYYECRPQKGWDAFKRENTSFAGLSLAARVQEVSNDMVKIKVENDENFSAPCRWFTYSTPYSAMNGTGWYSMPEIEDEVRLVFPNLKENESYVLSSVHLPTASSDRKNPDFKSWKTKYGKEILFTPDSIVIHNNNKTSITIKDNEGIILETPNDIKIQAKKDVSLESKEGSVLIQAKEKVDIKQSKIGICIDDDITFINGKLDMQ
ncbi:hypothetical protein FACS189418_5580 [Clostridia bacterium]|nr:hypothetical protein FACS189418_5580 [Clostridia bacterium]